MKVKFKKLHADVKLPVKGSPDAACYDVYAHSFICKGDGMVTYNLGFALEIPKGYKGVIIPRSNLTKHKWTINNSPGHIDSDYRGEVVVKMVTLAGIYDPIPYIKGDRVAQIYFEKVEEVEFEEMEELSHTYRGEGGFGSTGISTLNPAENTSTTYATPNFVTSTTNDEQDNNKH